MALQCPFLGLLRPCLKRNDSKPRRRAAKVLFHAKDMVFCGYRRDGCGLDLPGGKVEADEALWQCAEREIKEELHLRDVVQTRFHCQISGQDAACSFEMDLPSVIYEVHIFVVTVESPCGVSLSETGRTEMSAEGWRSLAFLCASLQGGRHPPEAGLRYACAVRQAAEAGRNPVFRRPRETEV